MLSNAELLAFLRDHVGCDDRFSLRLHPQSGRNRLLLATSQTNGSQYFVKLQPFGQATEAEAISAVSGSPIVLRPLVACAAKGITVYPYLPQARDLNEVVKSEPRAVLAALALLARDLPLLERVEPPASLKERRLQFDLPYPQLGQILDCSQACLAVVEQVQNGQLRHAFDMPETSSPVFSHGDIKLDNVLLEDDRIWLIDWEAAALAPAGTDSATLAATAIIAIVRSAGSSASEDRPSLAQGIAAAQFIKACYGRVGSPEGLSRFDSLLVRGIVQRVLGECSYKSAPHASDWLLLEIAEDISRHGLGRA